MFELLTLSKYNVKEVFLTGIRLISCDSTFKTLT